MRVPPEMRCRYCRLILCCGEHRLAHEVEVHAPKPLVATPLAGIPKFKTPKRPSLGRSTLDRSHETNNLDSASSRKRKRDLMDMRVLTASATLAPPKSKEVIVMVGEEDEKDGDVFLETPSRRHAVASAVAYRSPSTPGDVSMNISESSEASNVEENMSIVDSFSDVGSDRQDVTPTSHRDATGGLFQMPAPRLPSIRPRRRPPLIMYSMRRRRLLTPLEEEDLQRQEVPIASQE
ncbi:uncharacterized protein LOC124160370 [Ischnura elegans]|uniref:uncharacterized protein LOC124160370 n=1 Tax=Ischnura elegans TaxID=197161 RepID=UPI001ED89DD5|nr:uncharacterized protein LOC124160370 [Ischnura elegans]